MIRWILVRIHALCERNFDLQVRRWKAGEVDYEAVRLAGAHCGAWKDRIERLDRKNKSKTF